MRVERLEDTAIFQTVRDMPGSYLPGRDRSSPIKTERSERKYFVIREKLVDVTGIEPVTPCLQSRCSPS
jgi:hypothetical protein